MPTRFSSRMRSARGSRRRRIARPTGGDLVDQFVGQIDDIHQLGPGPGQAGAELGDEMAHAGFAAGDAIGFEHAHLRPAHAEGIADHVVERFRCRRYRPGSAKALAPDGFEQAVADKGFDFLLEDHAFMPIGASLAFASSSTAGEVFWPPTSSASGSR